MRSVYSEIAILMTDLSSRIRLTEPAVATSEDILHDAAQLLYPDHYRNLHGDPGTEIVYASRQYGDIRLTLADTNERNDHFLFAHYLWNASLQLAELISEAGDEYNSASAQWNVKGERVLEIGAGVSRVTQCLLNIK